MNMRRMPPDVPHPSNFPPAMPPNLPPMYPPNPPRPMYPPQPLSSAEMYQQPPMSNYPRPRETMQIIPIMPSITVTELYSSYM